MSENIKKALDDFEGDDFLAAKDKIKAEIKDKTNTFFKEKLGLTGDIEPVAAKEPDKSDKDGESDDKE